MIHKPGKEDRVQGLYRETCAMCGATRGIDYTKRRARVYPWMLAEQRQRYCMGGKP